MGCASKYLHVYNAAIAFTINTEERRGQARLVFRVLVEHSPRWAQTAEHGIGLTWRIMTLLSEGRCHLQQVWFPHPAVATEATYRSRFDAPLTFRADRPGLAYAARDLNLPISEQNQELHDLATSYLDSQLPRGRTPFTVQVRQAIEALLGTGTCGHRQVANALYMHPRTLQRRLREEGTSFEDIKGRHPARSSRTLPVPTRRAPDPGHRPARLQRTVSLGPKLPPLVSHHTPRLPYPSPNSHDGVINPSIQTSVNWGARARSPPRDTRMTQEPDRRLRPRRSGSSRRSRAEARGREWTSNVTALRCGPDGAQSASETTPLQGSGPPSWVSDSAPVGRRQAPRLP